MSADSLTLLMSVAALLVSVISVISAHRTTSRQNALQERLVTLENARESDRLKQARSAEIRAVVQNFGKGNYRLVLANEGPATARNINVEFDGQPMMEHQLMLKGEDPVTTLGAGATAQYHLAVSMGSPRMMQARITWEDDSGELRLWESQLKL